MDPEQQDEIFVAEILENFDKLIELRCPKVYSILPSFATHFSARNLIWIVCYSCNQTYFSNCSCWNCGALVCEFCGISCHLRSLRIFFCDACAGGIGTKALSTCILSRADKSIMKKRDLKRKRLTYHKLAEQ